MKRPDLSTLLLHTPFPKKDVHGSLNFPVYDNVAFEADSSEELEAVFQGEKAGHIYSRITNPSVEFFESKIRNATDAFAVTALSSGMAAITNLIMTLGKSGDNILTTRHIFGNTLSLFEKTLKPYGLSAKFTDLTDSQKIIDQIDQHTIAIFFETITNPQLEVADISVLSKIAREHNLLLIADTTLTPPSVFSAKEHGVDMEVLSSTKFISGGGTSVGGLIIDYGSYDWSSFHKTRAMYAEHGDNTFNVMLTKQVYRNMGACLSPHSAYMQSLGLDTLTLRTERSVSNASEIASWLTNHPHINRVDYPGLAHSPYYRVATKQFGDKPCSLLTFDLLSKSECYSFMNKLKLIRRSTNLQDNKSLIIHPDSTIFAEYLPEERANMGIRDTMMRLSVGIEYIDDLIQDLKQALE